MTQKRYLCPGCRQTLVVGPEWSGRARNCPECQKRHRVPQFAATAKTTESTTDLASPMHTLRELFDGNDQGPATAQTTGKLTFACEHCANTLTLLPTYAKLTVTCPYCQTKNPVPKANIATERPADAEVQLRAEEERAAAERAQVKAEQHAQAEAQRLAEERAVAERLTREEADRQAEAERLAEEERAAIERREQEEAERQAHAEAERLAQVEIQRLAEERATAERRANEEAARQAEAQRRAEERATTERLAREEAERQAQAEAERLAEAERAAVERCAQEDAERQAQAEAQRLGEEQRAAEERAAAERRAREDAEQLAQAEAQRLAEEQRAAEQLAHEEAERQVHAEAERLAAEERAAEERAAQVEAEQLAQVEAQRLAEEHAAAERRAREDAEQLAQAEAQRLAEEQRVAEQLAQEEAERQAQAEAERLAAELRAAEERAAQAEAEQLAQVEAQRLAEEHAAVERRAREDVERKAKPEDAANTLHAIVQSSVRAAPQFPIPEAHYLMEHQDIRTRLRILKRLCSCFAHGQRDPEFLFLGLRSAVSLRLTKQAKLFHDALETILAPAGRPCPAYFPIGLLYLQVAETERTSVLKQLQGLAATSVTLESALLLTGDDASGRLVFNSPQHCLAGLRSDSGRSRLSFLATADPPGVLTRAAQLAHAANESYNKAEPARVRRTLESLLELDGDQPDVLRNLLTVVSEQRDSVAYERYWRRYVDALLFRMLRGDHADSARMDLFRFYLKVAELTDREFADHQSKDHDHLRTPGLLARWLEAHTGLIWLSASESAYQSPATPNVSAGLARWWLQLFSPTVASFLTTDQAPEGGWELPCSEVQQALPFDPSERLFVRFVEWSKISFSLEEADGKPTPFMESVLALVASVARVPSAPYIDRLQTLFGEDRVQPIPFRSAMQNAARLPFLISRDRYAEAKDWAGLVRLLGDPELLPLLSDGLRMQLANAHARANDTQQAIAVAMKTLPDIPLKELQKDGYGHILWMNMIVACLNSLCERFEGDQLPPALSNLKSQLEQIPEHHPEWVELKLSCLMEVDELEQQLKLNVLIDATIERIKTMLGQCQFAEAKAEVHNLPESPEHVRTLKASLLKQIAEVEADAQAATRENTLIIARLMFKNVDRGRLFAIALENDVDTGNPLQFNGFLKAVEAQLNS